MNSGKMVSLGLLIMSGCAFSASAYLHGGMINFLAIAGLFLGIMGLAVFFDSKLDL